MQWRTDNYWGYTLLLLLVLFRSESHAHRTHRIPSPHSLHAGGREATFRGDEILSQQSTHSDLSFQYLSQPSVSAVLSIQGGARFPTDVISYIKSSKTRCWVLLVFSIMIEAAATTLNKRAADTKSVQLFGSSCILFLLWCVMFPCRSCASSFRRCLIPASLLAAVSPVLMWPSRELMSALPTRCGQP